MLSSQHVCSTSGFRYIPLRALFRLADRKKLTVQEYMLDNKTDAAFQLLDKKGAELIAPKYIQEAVAWIRA
jgi:hypothetical protein